MYTMKKKEINLQPSHVKAYRFIEKYTSKNLYGPEMLEISASIHSSPRQTYRIINDLKKLGYVSRTPHVPRSIKVIKPLA